MIDVSYSCILCSNRLTIKEINNQIKFICEECGFKETIELGLSQKESYKILQNNHQKKIRKNKSNKKAFPTRSSFRRKIRYDPELLEHDKLITKNVDLIKSKFIDGSLPSVMSKLISDKSHLPVHVEYFPKNLPESGKNPSKLGIDHRLIQKLKSKGIKKLYRYQEEVYEIIRDQKNLIITAPTGLGKTEAFLLPILQSIIDDKMSKVNKNIHAILIYPTKALAADQYEKIKYYCLSLGINVAVYDGDTPQDDRNGIYQAPPHLLITNPDMIHYHLMGNMSFQGIIKSVKFIVIDEIHLCVGAFGTNILWILRRLRRFSPKFISIGASATISNAKSFAETLFDQPVELIRVGNARKSDLYLSMLYPKERSNLSTMARVSTYFLEEGHKTLLFGNGHLSAESLNLILKQLGFNSQIHRAGLSISHRKKAENLFKSGKINALVSTPTLELGIDIGSLDCVISMLTSLTSFVQRIGRAGRQGQDSFATLVLRGDDPISAYFARNPNEYLSTLEPAYVEPNNSLVSYYQLLAMLLDKPLNSKEYKKYKDPLNKIEKEELIINTERGVAIRSREKIRENLSNYSIRGIGNSISILHNSKIIGERVLPIALTELHPGAIYLHGGRSYNVNQYNPKLRTSKVTSTVNRNIRTKALRKIWPRIESIEFEKEIDGLSASYCKLNLTETVNGFLTKDIFTNKLIDVQELDEPITYDYSTMGFILSLPKPYKEINHMHPTEKSDYLMGTFHAIEHVLIESGNSLTGGGANQIGGISMGDTGQIFVYDGTEGGSGLSNLLFDSLSKGMQRSLKIMQECPCKREDGCPRCTYSYYCGNNNQPLNRIGAIETLKLVGKESTELDLSFEGVETFVIDPIEINPFSEYSKFDLIMKNIALYKH
ncbi:MAG: putative ski2-type helicase [Candidatus Heimdallarchaeota archaeon LC_2]|nr:MAG: putative ski2-type helicase [Candidatus Heimdallarchaeota archaeon LC_2]